MKLAHLLVWSTFLILLCCSGSSNALRGRRRRLRTWHNPRLHGTWALPRRALETAPPANFTSKCNAACAEHGVCNEELGECFCPRHVTGPDCQQPVPDVKSTCLKWGFTTSSACMAKVPGACLNACNDRGTCIAGFCKCDTGFYGADCALSLRASDGKPELLAGLNYSVRASGPRVYVYELPGEYNMYKSVFRVDRPLYLLLLQRLTGAGVRVADPEEADYFFIPAKLRMYGDGEALLTAIAYIRKRWPYWDKYYGHRHLVVQAGDMGRVETSKEVRQMAVNVTFLTHWGLYEDQTRGDWPKSHRPGKDIVVPIFIQPALVDSYGMHTTPLHPVHARPRNASLQFFFAGRACGDRKQPLAGVYPNCDVGSRLAGLGYSAGTRQKVFYHHANRTGYTVVTHAKHYAKDMAAARFCLAPTGAGHGKRNTLVTMLGCVPVTMTDFVLQPFEPELNWSNFSIPIKEQDIGTMHTTLDAITPEAYDKLQVSLRCGAQHLFWSSIYGSIMGEDGRYDAFETLMSILRSRLLHPDVPPETLASLDPTLDAFMRCQPPPGSNVTEPPPARTLCTHTPADNQVEKCKGGPMIRTSLLIAGGAMCKGAPNLARCHRVYN